MAQRTPTPELVRSALDCIPPESLTHDERAKIAFAVFAAVGDDGADAWLQWAGRREGAKADEDRATWRSARNPGKVKAGTLFHFAKAYGFRWPDAQAPAPLTHAEVIARREAQRAAIERERKATEERQAEAATEALTLWERGADVTEPAAAPYLVRKGVRPYGVRTLPDGTLLVPARTAAGELVNVQRILAQPDDGPGKLFVKGARKTGTLHLIGLPDVGTMADEWLLIAEGYATAASLHEATGRPVAVAWDAGNLAHAVRALRGRFPRARLALCGDDDRATEARTGRNPGRAKATEAAGIAGKGRGLVILPTMGPAGLPEDGSGGTDFNDLHARAGLGAVRDAVEAALQAAETALQGANGAAPEPEGARRRKTRPAAHHAADDGAAPRDRFRVDEQGTWYDPPDDGPPVKVCAPLHVEALARDRHDNGAALVLQFDTRFGVRRWVMQLAMLAGDGTGYRGELLGMGFVVPHDKRRRDLLSQYLGTRNPGELVRLVDRVGWQGGAYVLPRETLGIQASGERVLFHSDGPLESAFAQRGTLDEWRERIARHCPSNPRLAFVVSLAFAGPLLAATPGADGGGFHLVGDSSGGKTTALRVAASVWGGPGYLQRWRATDNGLEALAAQHSDGLLVLDELAQLDGRVAGESAYMLANGQGKSRAGRTGAARPRAEWRLLFLSAGEVGLAQHMNEAGKQTRAGQELRMIDLPADAGAGLGVFNDCADYESPSDFAKWLAQHCAAVYGVAGRAWLLWLIEHRAEVQEAIRTRLGAIERAMVPEAASGQVQRVGRRFALAALAGELASSPAKVSQAPPGKVASAHAAAMSPASGLTGWPHGTATRAARDCFNAWLLSRPGGIGQSEDAAILRQLREWFGRHSEARFTPWERSALDDDHAPKTMNRAGWRKAVVLDVCDKGGNPKQPADGCEWYVLPDVFRAEVCKGYGDRAALMLLRDRGHLHADKRDGFQCRVRAPGEGLVSVYRIKSSLLSDASD